MRTVLLGTDFMYDSNGKLVPIEINTNVGLDHFIFEKIDDVFNLSNLKIFIQSKNFIKLSYIGDIIPLHEKLEILCKDLSIEYRKYVSDNSLTIPIVEDSEDHLIIRSAYDTTAIVDDVYCRDKTNFLNLIKNQTFGHQYAYIDENNNLINYITNIPDNGNHPNFILKCNEPNYDKNLYPKFFKVSNITELNVILQNITKGYHLVEFHYNEEKLKYNHIQVIRSYNILFPPELNSITIGQYSKITSRNIDNLSTFNENFELLYSDRGKYITSDGGISSPKLLDDDKVQMADGTFKTALELQVDDVVKTVFIPGLEESNMFVFKEDYNVFVSGATYSSNKILNKIKVDKIVDYVKITFTDNTHWEDTKNSAYLTRRIETISGITTDFVFFALLNNDSPNDLKIGDNIILINTLSNDLEYVLKEVSNIEITRQIFSGWDITVEEKHVFLTQNSENNASYVAIEHNTLCNSPNCDTDAACIKGEVCCHGYCDTFCTSSDCCDWWFGAVSKGTGTWYDCDGGYTSEYFYESPQYLEVCVKPNTPLGGVLSTGSMYNTGTRCGT